ncbi:MAG: hypothetical protein JJT77_12900 [Crocinitomicaceae bacterium]|nr:hypothetical protein [Crocinitomicaceae bacterium]
MQYVPTGGDGKNGVRQLEFCRQFYNTFPKVNALRSQLNWTQYRLLLRINDDDKRTYYIEETCNNNWSFRQLERQINTFGFVR